MNPKVVQAIFRRNFHSYFNNPTGFVFMGLFVVLASFATYVPDNFFASNLANLNTLSFWMPYILLLYVPAITMSVWADERRQGTDELLLTLPATDIDVVIGKYLAAVSVFTVALVFSLVWNLGCLRWLGKPDLFLFFANYFGYWLVGLAMLATGMVASFFTSNLTVSFILGVVLNTPLVLADWAASVISRSDAAAAIKHWGIAEQFRDLGRGVISLDSIVYYLGITAVMLYLSLVLIGRRHWMGGRDGHSLIGHYLARAVSLVLIVAALNMLVESVDARWSAHYDVTAERVNSLVPETVNLIRNLDTKGRPIKVEAYVSPSVPENYVQVRTNLLNALREFERLGAGKIEVEVVSAEPNTKEATDAEKKFGIKPQTVLAKSRGALKDEQILLGVAVRCGLEKVIVPFFDQGMSVEYELARSIATAAQQKRKRLGIVTTDANLFGGFDMMAMQMGQMSMKPRQPIVDELEKQYEVVQVDAAKPIEKFDALLVLQPSSLAQPQINNLITAIKNGQATAIFEDPLPGFFQGVPGTSDEKQSMGPMGPMPGGQKGDLQPLWDLLGVDMVSRSMKEAFGPAPSQALVIWQDWISNPRLRELHLPREFVFIDRDEPGAGQGVGKSAFNDINPVTSNLQELWFPWPGGFTTRNTSKMKFEPLVMTGTYTGAISPRDVRSLMRGQNRGPLERKEEENTTRDQYALVARVTGEVKSSEPAADDKPDDKKPENKKDEKKSDAKAADKEKDKDTDGKSAADGKAQDDKAAGDKASDKTGPAKSASKTHNIHVILVGDIDLIESQIFNLRARAQEDDVVGELRFDNITLVLNLLDSLVGDDRFMEIRKHRPVHRTLETLDRKVQENREALADKQKKYEQDYEAQKQKVKAAVDKANDKFHELEKEVKGYQAKGEDPPPSLRQRYLEALMNYKAEETRVKSDIERIDRDLQRETEVAARDLKSDINSSQNHFKFWAVVLPPIIPIILAAFVFFSRRAEEREGVSKARLR